MAEFPVSIPEGAYDWMTQVSQYADAEPPEVEGITYYAGDVSDNYPDKPPVDCLLYWAPGVKGLRIVGILNHYPVDYPPHEKAGNVNVWTRKSHQRRGVATALCNEARKRWGVTLDGQRFTYSGARLARYLSGRRQPDE